MFDMRFTEQGDVQVDASGDIAITDTPWRDDVQQAYLRMMTDVGDFVLYPTLGCDLSQLYGLPQSPATAQYGVALINSGLARENRFGNSRVNINAVPTGYTTLRFDVTITSGSQQLINLAVVQNLGI